MGSGQKGFHLNFPFWGLGRLEALGCFRGAIINIHHAYIGMIPASSEVGFEGGASYPSRGCSVLEASGLKVTKMEAQSS